MKLTNTDNTAQIPLSFQRKAVQDYRVRQPPQVNATPLQAEPSTSDLPSSTAPSQHSATTSPPPEPSTPQAIPSAPPSSNGSTADPEVDVESGTDSDSDAQPKPRKFLINSVFLSLLLI
jgi:hypothetical protein